MITPDLFPELVERGMGARVLQTYLLLRQSLAQAGRKLETPWEAPALVAEGPPSVRMGRYGPILRTAIPLNGKPALVDAIALLAAGVELPVNTKRDTAMFAPASIIPLFR